MASLYNDRYLIGVEIEDTELDYDPALYSFFIKDSIYNLFPTASMTFRDLSGQFSEYLTFINGVKVKITFGSSEESITCPFVVVKNSIPEQIVSNNIGGISEIPLVHDYYYYQSKQSLAFNDEISNIIKKKIRNYNFNSTDIDTTINKGIWYQPYITDSEFMTKKLLPFAYSTDSNDSPFYLFIDVNNNFYFKSYKKLYIDSKSYGNYKLVQNMTLEDMSNDTFYSFNPIQMSISDLQPNLHRIIYNFDKDGNYVSFQDFITDYPSSSDKSKVIPITWNLDNINSLKEILSYDVKYDNTKNNNQGLINNSMKKIYGIEKVIIMSNVNINLRAGKKITLNLPVGSDNTKIDSSQRYSGDYLIETSYHKWTGSVGRTILVCSRQDIKLPGNYTRQSLLLSR